MNRERIQSAFEKAVERLLQEMNPDGFWQGELSSSALSTATAVSALSISKTGRDAKLIQDGVSWLLRTRNADGGWGDTTDSPSNLSTTLLAVAALTLAAPLMGLDLKSSPIKNESSPIKNIVDGAYGYMAPLTARGTTPSQLVAAIQGIYGADRTFAAPILANCALAGMVPWDQVPGLPFELAVFPRAWYKALRLHVVSYALPALIAIGLSINHNAPPRCPIRRTIRRAAAKPALSRLEQIQPANGGFLESTPLTSFVAMSLAPICGTSHPVVDKCLRFIRESQRPDGSWPIDSNLSVWLTTGAVSALAAAGRLQEIDVEKTRRWIAERQFHSIHPFTGAAPGGWGWTHLPGSVPDADDTSGAVLACMRLGERDVARAGVDWLLGLQNADGGWPTFCRGWGRLPFDKSTPDITAHALRAFWSFDPDGRDLRCKRAMNRGLRYLASVQRADGAWTPLWFGNQSTSGKCNPVFGTSRVLLAYAELGISGTEAGKGIQYLLEAQNPDGGWSGVSSIEETALAVTALFRSERSPDMDRALLRGIEYLVQRVEDDSWTVPTPIGLYFSSLWYSEKLYPVIWTVEALGLGTRTARENAGVLNHETKCCPDRAVI